MIRRGFVVFLSCLFLSVGLGLTQELVEPLEQRIRKKVKRFVEEQITADSMDVRVEIPASVDCGIESSEFTEIRIDWRRGHDDLTGRVVIPVSLMRKGKRLLTTYASVTIRLFGRVFVAKALMNRHQKLFKDDVQKEMREVTKLTCSPFKDAATLLVMRTKRVIGRGRIITEDMVEMPPLIHQGDRVQLILVYGNLKVTTTGFARKDGWLGDRIRIRNPKSRTEIVGRVISPTEVEVQL